MGEAGLWWSGGIGTAFALAMMPRPSPNKKVKKTFKAKRLDLFYSIEMQFKAPDC